MWLPWRSQTRGLGWALAALKFCSDDLEQCCGPSVRGHQPTNQAELVMSLDRRAFVLASATATLVGSATPAPAAQTGLYGLMSSLTAKSGHRDELAAILAGASEGLPGCRSYVVALDTSRDDMIWVTEVWESKELHEASLKTPKVMDAIARGRPCPSSGFSGHVSV